MYRRQNARAWSVYFRYVIRRTCNLHREIALVENERDSVSANIEREKEKIEGLGSGRKVHV